jgi:integrase
MLTHNPENERLKREYLGYLRDAKGLSEQSLDLAAKSIHRFEVFTKFRSFRKFHIEQAKAFRRHLATTKSRANGKPLSLSTVLQTLNALRTFFVWLAGLPGYKSKIRHSDTAYFRMSEKEERIARAEHPRPVPTLEQIRRVLALMPANTEVELRNRALIAFTLLTGIRDGAMASLKVKHVSLERGEIEQDAREVKTKFSKSFTTCFFPVGDDIRSIVEDWIVYLRTVKLWSYDDPLFPATAVANGATRQFVAVGLSHSHWANAGSIRKIFRDAFALAGLPYFNPHSFRKTLVQLGEQICSRPEQFKAWSQNLGHEDVMTTLRSYGEISHSRQAEIIKGLSLTNGVGTEPAKILKALEKMLTGSSSGAADT